MTDCPQSSVIPRCLPKWPLGREAGTGDTQDTHDYARGTSREQDRPCGGGGAGASGGAGRACLSSVSAAPGLVTGGVADQGEREGELAAAGHWAGRYRAGCIVLSSHVGRADLCPGPSFAQCQHMPGAGEGRSGARDSCGPCSQESPRPEEGEGVLAPTLARLGTEPGPRGQGPTADTAKGPSGVCAQAHLAQGHTRSASLSPSSFLWLLLLTLSSATYTEACPGHPLSTLVLAIGPRLLNGDPVCPSALA